MLSWKKRRGVMLNNVPLQKRACVQPLCRSEFRQNMMNSIGNLVP